MPGLAKITSMETGPCECGRAAYGLLLVARGKVREMYSITPCDVCLIERILNATD